MPPTEEEILDWWEWTYEDEWRRQLREDGYVLFPEDDRNQIALIAEGRWQPVMYGCTVPSRLWDASTPTAIKYVGSSSSSKRAKRALTATR